MFTAEQARDRANEYNGRHNLQAISRQIRERAKSGLYYYIIWMKQFEYFTCSIEDIEQLGYKVEILFDRTYQANYLYITWD